MPTRSTERHWTLTAFGVFAAAFPGVALGYFLRADGDSVVTVYATTLGFAGASWLVFALLARGLRVKAELLLPVLGAIAIAIYYFFAARSMAATLGAGEAAIMGIRVGTWGLTAFWLWRAMRSLRSAQVRRTARPQPAVLPRKSEGE
jgi:ABC-type Mn2+/Zn2+ transport system permease subunit